MLENILTLKKYSHKTKLTVKSIVAVSLVALAVVLPQIVHLAAGQAGGVTWLPMYLPVLLAGCLLGTSWGLAVGVASPLVSFALTSLWGSAMPAAARLPFMIAELAVFAAVSGLFSKKHFQKRSVCLRGDCACHSLRQGGIYAVCHCFSVGRAVYSGARVVSDSVWAGRGGRAGGACAARCHGGPPSYAERQQ